MNNQNTISFCSEDISFEFEHQLLVEKWIKEAILIEGKSMGEITYIFCSDDYLHKINLEHLKHDTFTDIITFDYCVDEIINSDIFISIDRVKDNALTFQTMFQDELFRVMIHGVLHLLGYKDKLDTEKKMMRSKEDFYLTLLLI
jgi:probable rRNA maturation factor